MFLHVFVAYLEILWVVPSFAFLLNLSLVRNNLEVWVFFKSGSLYWLLSIQKYPFFLIVQAEWAIIAIPVN